MAKTTQGRQEAAGRGTAQRAAHAGAEAVPHHGLRWRRTKIVATLGPATGNATAIERLLKAGVDVVRLNMSHGDHAGHREKFALVRRIGAKMGRYVAILVDLCGPKIRAGRFPAGSITLESGQDVLIDTRRATGEPGVIASQYRDLHKDVKPGERVLLDDGNLELQVLEAVGTQVRCRVVHGGVLKDNKGINLPDSVVSAPSITAKDREDAALAVELGADYIAQSFVRSAADVHALKRLLKRLGADTPIIVKVEKPEAVRNIEEILRACEGIMVARGDLGIELPAESVPLIQQDLIRLARLHNRPVIVATQMLESMVTQSRPTRAEVGDVANAVMLSTDAVMLSAETASGKHPIEAVHTMDRVVREIERYRWKQGSFAEVIEYRGADGTIPVRDAVAHATSTLAQDLRLHAIIIPTNTGLTARVLATNRPTAPMLAVANSDRVCRQLNLHWGVVPLVIPRADIKNWRALCGRISKLVGLPEPGHTVLLVSGFNDDPQKNEPALKILHL